MRQLNTIVTLKKGEGRTVRAGGAWIFDNEIDDISGRFKNGSLVRVRDSEEYPMGIGYINQNSKIRIRMLTRDPEQEIDFPFIAGRVQAAWDYRKRVMLSEADLNCCRVIFGEADFLPGITVDKYDDVLVMEALTLGAEVVSVSISAGDESADDAIPLKQAVAAALIRAMEADGYKIRAVYERNDAREREKEGAKRYKALMWTGESGWISDLTQEEAAKVCEAFDPHVEIIENGVRYLIDVKDGQKTGFFLDQKYNRLAMQRICRNADRVLDCFTHMGTFALNAGISGAKDVLGLDISEFAIAQATENAERNGLSDTVSFRCADVLDELPALAAAGERFDVVILDPPAFTKSREATKNAIRGYREINMKGLVLVENGGYFATCSCSHFMTEELFAKTVKEAAKAAHKRLRQVEFRTQACDHPILWANSPNVPESYYLKFLIFQVTDE